MEVTTLAIEKLKEVLEEQGEQEGSLRVIAIPAETGGLQYMLTMENESQSDDTELRLEGVRFLMDSDSASVPGRGHHRLRRELRRPGRLRHQQPPCSPRLAVAALAAAAEPAVADAVVAAADAAATRPNRPPTTLLAPKPAEAPDTPGPLSIPRSEPRGSLLQLSTSPLPSSPVPARRPCPIAYPVYTQPVEGPTSIP